MVLKQSVLEFQSRIFLVVLLLCATVCGDPCPGFDCYIESVGDEQILDCNYRVNLKFVDNYRLIKCEYDAKRKGVFLTASAADDNFVNKLAYGIFKRLSSLVSRIEEFGISHIKVSSLSRSDFTNFGKLKVLMLMEPDSIENDSFVDIADPKYFQFYVYCAGQPSHGFSALRIPSKSWRIIVRHCGYTSKCEAGMCLDGIELKNESYIKFTSNLDILEPEMVFHSSSCVKPQKICPISLTTTTEIASTPLETTRKMLSETKAPPKELLLRVISSSMNQFNSPVKEQLEPSTSLGDKSKHVMIIIIVVMVNVALIVVLIFLGVYRHRQLQDRKPCRGKHTIVLD